MHVTVIRITRTDDGIVCQHSTQTDPIARTKLGDNLKVVRADARRSHWNDAA